MSGRLYRVVEFHPPVQAGDGDVLQINGSTYVVWDHAGQFVRSGTVVNKTPRPPVSLEESWRKPAMEQIKDRFEGRVTPRPPEHKKPPPMARCTKHRRGEYNLMRCCLEEDHRGDCNWVAVYPTPNMSGGYQPEGLEGSVKPPPKKP